MPGWNDERLERIVSRLLIAGVVLSAAVVLWGAACYLSLHGHEPAEYRIFHGVPTSYRSLPGVLHALSPSNCLAVIQLGLLILIATPIVRVAFSLAGFAFERDRTYVAITSIVLAVLLYSVVAEH